MSFSHKGYPIELDSNGRFNATVDDIEVSAESLKDAQAKIDHATRPAALAKKKVALPVVGILEPVRRWDAPKGWKPSIHRSVVTGINRTSRALQFSGEFPKGTEYSKNTVMADTPENTALLERKIAADAEDEAVSTALSGRSLDPSGYGRIEPSEYDKIIADLVAKHKSRRVESGRTKG